MSRERLGQRGPIQQDITDKILTGEIATLHLPARDMGVFYKVANGELIKEFASDDIGMHPRSIQRSLGYLREAFGVERIEQAFGMLVARGLPLPDEFMPEYYPEYEKPHFTKKQLHVLKLWVEGKSNMDMRADLVVGKEAIGMHLYRMREKVDAKSNIQLVAVAIKEGALRPHQDENGQWTFETFHPKDRKRIPLSAVIFSPHQR